MRMISRLRVALFTPWLVGWVIATLGVGTLAYQVGGNYSIAPSSYSNHAYFPGFEQPEGQPTNRFRWSLPSSCICLPGLGAYPLTLRLKLAGVYPPGTIRKGRVLVNNQPVGD